jgi:hypothetical protein
MGIPRYLRRMGGTTVVSFRSAPTAELNLKLSKHSGDADGFFSQLCASFTTPELKLEVEKIFF